MAVYDLLLIVTVTTSPFGASHRTGHHQGLRMLGAVRSRRRQTRYLMVNCGTVISTSTSRSAEARLPALSETAALMVWCRPPMLLIRGQRSDAQLPLACTVVV